VQVVARQPAGLHVARAAVLAAAAAAAVALAAHALSAGCLDLRGTTAAVLLCAPAAWAVTAKQRSATVLLGWLSGTQLAVHLVLTALCGDALTVSLPAVLWHAAAVLGTAAVLHAGDASLWAAQRVRRATGHVLHLLVPPALVVAARSGAQGVLRRRPVVRRVDWRGPTPARRGPPEAVPASC